jgi:hypothetical protein
MSFESISQTHNLLNRSKLNLDNEKKTLLDSLPENHTAITPFIEKTDIITQITEAFLRFFHWLFNIPPSFPLSEMETQFSMHLYRNFDVELMKKNHPSEENRDLPLSFVLKSWNAFLEKSNSPTLIDSSALKQCIEYQEKIEEARSSNWWKSRIIDGLECSITKQIRELQPGRSAYLPGGVMIPEKGLDSNKVLLALNAKANAVEMIYEIRRNENGLGLTWRVYNYSTQGSALMETSLDLQNISGMLKNIISEKREGAFVEYQLTEEDFLKNLRSLLDVQVSSHKALSMGICGKIEYAYKTVKAILNVNDSNSNLNLLSDLSVVHFNNIFKEYKSKIVNSQTPKLLVTFSSNTNSEKLYEVFAKSLDLNEMKIEKLLLKSTLFFNIYEKTKTHLGDTHWRKWIKDNAIHLLKLIKKEFGTQLELVNMEKKLEQIMDQIAQKESLEAFTNPVGPEEQKKSKSAFDDPLVFASSPYPMTAFKSVSESKNFSFLAPLNAIDFENISFKEAQDQFKLWVEQCNDLSEKEKLEDLSLLLNDAFGAIHFAEKSRFWDKIPREELEEWSGMIRLLGQFATQVHFGSNTRGPLPQRLYQLLKTLEICQKLALRNHEITCFDGYCMDMEPMRDILHDPYLDLGAVGPQMHEVLNAIEEPGSAKLRLIKTSFFDFDKEKKAEFLSSAEGNFLTKFLNKKKLSHPDLVEEDLLADIGQKEVLPPQIVHLRQLNILILMMAAKYRTLHVPGIGNRIKLMFKGIIQALKRKSEDKKSDLTKLVIHEQMAMIDSYLFSKKLPNSFSSEASVGVAFWEKHPKINPYGIYMNDYDDVLFFSQSHQNKQPFISTHFSSIYDETGEKIKTDDIKERVVEGAVADVDGMHVQEDGTPFSSHAHTTTTAEPDGTLKVTTVEEGTHSKRYAPAGKTQTERAILDEGFRFPQFPYDISADLQLMQTSEETRIQNTLALFSKEPYLLGYIEWRRVFSLNLFRNGALYSLLKKKPEYAVVVAKSLRKMMSVFEAIHNIKGMLFLMQIYELARKSAETLCNELKNDCAANFAVLSSWVESSERDSSLKQCRSLYHTFLIYYADLLAPKLLDLCYNLRDKLDNQELLAILKSHFLRSQTPQFSDEINRTHEMSIQYMIHRLIPYFKELMQDETTRNGFLSSLAQIQTNRKLINWVASPEYPIYRSGIYEIDLSAGVLFENGIAQTMLPEQIITDSKCQELFGKETLCGISVRHWIVKGENLTGRLYEFMWNSKEYRIVLLENEAPIIYKKCAESNDTSDWYQLQQIHSLPTGNDTIDKLGDILDSENKPKLLDIAKKCKIRNIPEALVSNYCWIDSKNRSFFIQNYEGKELYRGEFSNKLGSEWKEASEAIRNSLNKVVSLQYLDSDKPKQILNSFSDENLDRFLDLAQPNRILAYGKDEKVNEVEYSQLGLKYVWNEQNQCWDCPNYPGYHLSDKKVEDLLKVDSNENKHPNPTFFHTEFQHYHLLENGSKLPRLILVNEEYQKQKLDKHYRKKIIPNHNNSDARTIYSFEIDPVQGLITQNGHGYFYLAYLLFSQSKYKQALFYLRKAQDIKPGISQETEKILNLFETWQVSSPNANAVLLHVRLLAFEQSKMIHKSSSDSKNKDLSDKVKQGYLQYQMWMGENKIHPQLYLSEKERNLIPTSEDELALCAQEIKYFKEKISENIAKNTLLTLSKKMKYEEPIFNFNKSYFAEPSLEPKIDSIDVTKLRKVFQSKGSYTKQLGKELIIDLQKAEKTHKKNTQYLNTTLNLSKLQEEIQREQRCLLQQTLDLRNEIINSLRIPKGLEPLGLDKVLERIKEYDQAKEKYLEKSLFCFASGDWADLINENIIEEEKIEALEKKIEGFLISSTTQNQYQKSLDLIDQLQKAKSGEKSEPIKIQICQLLGMKRSYDPKNDPQRRSILLLEYTAKIILRKNQIKNIRDMLSKENLFKHEALAGGKTTVLRNIITKIKAEGTNLSGAITHDPLIEMHHPLLEQSATQCYGDKAYRFEFSRGDPTDQAALQRILRNMLKTIAEKGRIDFTKRDLLSLHHSFILKFETLQHVSEEDSSNLHVEIDLLTEIFDLLEEKGRIGSDELDKVCDPEKEHNYAISSQRGGNKINLQTTKCETALKMLQWIISDHDCYANIFKNDLQYRMDNNAVKQFMTWLAKQVYKEYLPNTDEALAIAYLTGIADKEKNFTPQQLQQFYATHVNTKAQDIRDTIASFYTYLKMVIPGTLAKRGGVQFGRSKDGLLVRPFEENGKCAEKSEHGTEEETIWYTCLNYMDQNHGGITVEQIAQLIKTKQTKAAMAVVDALKIDPNNPLNYQNTNIAKEFFSKYGYNLEAITSSDYKALTKKIMNTPHLLADFLRSQVLSQIKLTQEKIVGNSQDLVSFFKEFYGSSGTSNSYRALPDKILKEKKLVKQPGVDGAILKSLLETYKEGDIIKCNDDLGKSIAEEVYKFQGGALIDLGPAFSGMTGLNIAKEIAKQKNPLIPIRFIDVDNHVKIYYPTRDEVTLANESNDVNEMITVFAQPHTRGTDLSLSNQSTGYVTISPQTRFSDFIQAVGRMRKLGKGQKVRYLIDSSVAKQLENMDLENLLAFLNDNEAKSLKKLHRKAEKQKIRAIGKQAIFKQLRRVKKTLRKDLWTYSRSYFIEPTQESLAQQGIPEEKIDTIKVLVTLAIKEKNKLQIFLENVSSSLLDSNKAILEAISKLDDKISKKTIITELYLPKKDYDTLFEQNMQQEVEKEQEKEQEKAQQQEQQQEQILASGEGVKVAWHKFDLASPEELANRIQLPNGDFHYLATYNFFYESNILFTENFYHTLNNMQPWGTEGINAPLTLNQMRNPRFVILVDKRNGEDAMKIRALLATQKDFDHVLEKLDAVVQNNKVDYYIYNIYQDDLDGRKTKWNHYPEKIQKKLARIIAQVKLLNGEFNLLHATKGSSVIRQEAIAMNAWMKKQIKSKGLNPAVLEANLKKYLRTMRPSEFEYYRGSTMAMIFNHVIEETKKEMESINRDLIDFEKMLTEEFTNLTKLIPELQL